MASNRGGIDPTAESGVKHCATQGRLSQSLHGSNFKFRKRHRRSRVRECRLVPSQTPRGQELYNSRKNFAARGVCLAPSWKPHTIHEELPATSGAPRSDGFLRSASQVLRLRRSTSR
jgi:hypothetical protein